MRKLASPKAIKRRQELWSSFISNRALSPERHPDESQEAYKERLKSNKKIEKILLRRSGGHRSGLVPIKQLIWREKTVMSKGNGASGKRKGKFKYIKASEEDLIRLDVKDATKELKKIDGKIFGGSSRRNYKVPAIQAQKFIKVKVN